MVERYPAQLRVQCCDFSKKAIGFVCQNPLFSPAQHEAGVCDLVNDAAIPFEPHTAHFAQLIFVLSAIAPQHHLSVLEKIGKHLRPGAVLYFRDYGRYDLAQLRFSKSGKSKISDNFYARIDKTRAYYFTTEQVFELFLRAGFDQVENKYFCRVVVNRKDNKTMHRVWVQARFVKK